MQIVGWYGWNFWYPAIFGVDDYESELKNRNSKCWTEVQKVDWFARKSILSVSFGVCDNEFKLKNRKVKMKHLKWWKVRPSYSFCHFDFTNLEFTFVITDPENPVAWFNLKKKNNSFGSAVISDLWNRILKDYQHDLEKIFFLKKPLILTFVYL